MEHLQEELPHSENGHGDLEFPAVSDIKKRTMLMALKKNLGIISRAASVTGINRDTHYEWCKTDADYKRSYDMIKEMAIDFAEGKMFELINGVTVKDIIRGGTVYTLPPNVAAVIWYLKTKAKHRGYVERLQIEDMPDKEYDSTLEI